MFVCLAKISKHNLVMTFKKKELKTMTGLAHLSYTAMIARMQLNTKEYE